MRLRIAAEKSSAGTRASAYPSARRSPCRLSSDCTGVETTWPSDERRYAAPLPMLDEQWEGTEVAVFSDLQVGMWWDNAGMVERVVDRVVEEDPDAVLLGGDFVYSQDPSVEVQGGTVMELLAPILDAGIPTYAVLGNHDHAWEQPRSSPRRLRATASRCC